MRGNRARAYLFIAVCALWIVLMMEKNPQPVSASGAPAAQALAGR